MAARLHNLSNSSDSHRGALNVYYGLVSRQTRSIFISYAHQDATWAELEEAGYQAVVQAWDFPPGGNWVAEMDKALAQADCLLAVISPHYLESPMAQAEWRAKFAKDPSGAKRTLIPVRVGTCEPDGLLHPVIYADLVALDELQARTRLISGVSRARGKRKVPFPGVRSEARPAPPFPGAIQFARPPETTTLEKGSAVPFERVPQKAIDGDSGPILVSTDFRVESSDSGTRRIDVDLAFLVERIPTGLMVKTSISIGCTEVAIRLTADGASFVSCYESKEEGGVQSAPAVSTTRLQSTTVKWDLCNARAPGGSRRLLSGNHVLWATFAPIYPVDIKSSVRALDRLIFDSEHRPLTRLGSVGLMAKLLASGQRLPDLESVEETIKVRA
jgi:hypothetical protein